MSEQDILRKKYLKRVIIALILLLVGVGCLFANKPLSDKYEAVCGELEHTSLLAQKIADVSSDVDRYNQELLDSGKVYDNIIANKDAYISFLGDATMANRLEINKMTVGEVSRIGNGLYSMKIDIDIAGDLYNIKNFVQELYDDQTVSRINAVSYRLQQKDLDGNTFDWMWREIDNRNLVGWWTMAGGEVASEADLYKGKGTLVLSANDFMRHEPALCYLEVEFLGTGG